MVPIINENDTVVTDEIKFGDNDTLGALVANLIEADALLILTDQTGLFTADPRKDPAATLIGEATAGDEALEAMAGGAGSAKMCIRDRDHTLFALKDGTVKFAVKGARNRRTVIIVPAAA